MEVLKIGDRSLLYPIIQGGMGVGISLSSLAAHVAGNGGMGIISTAQIGFRDDDFYKNPIPTNLRAIKTELYKARALAAQVFEKFKDSNRAAKFLDKLKDYVPFIGFNIMVATNKYADYVIEAVKAGADIIISGAGLPIDLPELVQKGQEISGNEKKTCIAPIVSSRKSAKVILKMWDRKYKTTADAVVIEGPLAGGHLGFSYEELHELGADTMASKNYKRDKYDAEIKEIIEEVRIYEEKFGKKIPVFVAGGIYTKEDMAHAMSLGADGVQMGTRFVTTYECDAPDDYKQTYIDAKEEDIVITKSPVGMPGRAIRNDFMDRLKKGPVPIRRCCNCLATSVCDRKTIPYCITEALCCAANSDESHALLFCGANAYRANKIEHVSDIINELTENI